MWGANTSQTKMVSMLDSIGVHICELLTIDDVFREKTLTFHLVSYFAIGSKRRLKCLLH